MQINFIVLTYCNNENLMGQHLECKYFHSSISNVSDYIHMERCLLISKTYDSYEKWLDIFLKN